MTRKKKRHLYDAIHDDIPLPDDSIPSGSRLQEVLPVENLTSLNGNQRDWGDDKRWSTLLAYRSNRLPPSPSSKLHLLEDEQSLVQQPWLRKISGPVHLIIFRMSTPAASRCPL